MRQRTGHAFLTLFLSTSILIPSWCPLLLLILHPLHPSISSDPLSLSIIYLSLVASDRQVGQDGMGASATGILLLTHGHGKACLPSRLVGSDFLPLPTTLFVFVGMVDPSGQVVCIPGRHSVVLAHYLLPVKHAAMVDIYHPGNYSVLLFFFAVLVVGGLVCPLPDGLLRLLPMLSPSACWTYLPCLLPVANSVPNPALLVPLTPSPNLPHPLPPTQPSMCFPTPSAQTLPPDPRCDRPQDFHPGCSAARTPVTTLWHGYLCSYNILPFLPFIVIYIFI